MSVCVCLMWKFQLWVRKALLPVRHSNQEGLHTPRFTHEKKPVCSALATLLSTGVNSPFI